jgi:SAM-dependent methyltransferase
MLTILDFPRIFNTFTRIVGGDLLAVFVDRYLRPEEGDKILDIGCGPADILSYLPRVEYVGLDMNSAYIDHARKRFGNKGRFLAQRISRGVINAISPSGFDTVLAKGVLHHLNDAEAIQLFELARFALKPAGRLITFDGCYVKGQSCLARLILSKDRGKFVRTQKEYLDLASTLFKKVHASIHHDLIRIPYTHIIMECIA